MSVLDEIQNAFYAEKSVSQKMNDALQLIDSDLIFTYHGHYPRPSFSIHSGEFGDLNVFCEIEKGSVIKSEMSDTPSNGDYKSVLFKLNKMISDGDL